MPQPPESIWERVREELRREAPDFKFHIWLDPLELAAVQDRTLFVRAPDHIRGWVAERYMPLIRAAAVRGFDERAVVEIVGEDWSPTESSSDEPGPAEPPECALNPKYTFEQFVIGSANRFAHAAALAVAELPAQAYNPLFLHGPPGLGKTHLLHAVGNYMVRYGRGLNVRYATVEEFTSEFVGAIRDGTTGAFKHRFRTADVVLIDDVQFLARKDRTREEFFHTFNALCESGRQLIVTSDRSPDELPEIEQRLSERFRSGLVVEIDRPGLGARRAILAMRARLDALELSTDVLDEISHLVTSSVRALEGALIRVVAYASLKDQPPTPALAREVLGRCERDELRSDLRLSEIVDAAAAEFDVSRRDVLARNRRTDATLARQVAMYLARELTTESLPEIGRATGGRSHTTVLHGVNKVATTLPNDASLREAVDSLRSRLRRPAGRPG